MKQTLLAMGLGILMLGAHAQANLYWSENFNDNYFNDTLVGECGNGQGAPCCGTGISLFITTWAPRAGSRAGVTRLDKCHERAEWRGKTNNRPNIGDTRFYGFSLKPAHNYDANRWTLAMQLAQWSSSNPAWAEGAWHRLIIENNRWRYVYKYSENGGQNSSSVKEQSFDLGPVSKNQWTDFIVRGTWKRSNQGKIQVYIRQPGSSNYTMKYSKTGWIMLNIPQVPYFKVGQYRGDPNWSGINQQDRLYVDEIKVGQYFGNVDI
ncbi:MAG: heparin lyase I family protein [Verrucomicrobiota bacterium]